MASPPLCGRASRSARLQNGKIRLPAIWKRTWLPIVAAPWRVVLFTALYSDVATGWTECIGLLARDQTMIVDALSRLRGRLPFPFFGLDTDNDAVFINETVLSYCRQNAIEFTRSRAYRKNDQAWIEQKNGSVVRKLVGYGRLEGMTATMRWRICTRPRGFRSTSSNPRSS